MDSKGCRPTVRKRLDPTDRFSPHNSRLRGIHYSIPFEPPSSLPVEDLGLTFAQPTAGITTAAESARQSLARLAAPTDLPLPELFRRVCEAAVETLRIDRAGIWLFVNGDQMLRCVNVFERSSRKHGKGACLALGECPAFLRAIASAPLLPCESARTDPRTVELASSYFAPLGIASTLDAPLQRDGRLIGVLFCEHIGSPRGWSDADRAYALALAEFVVQRIKAAESALKTTAGTQYIVTPPPPVPVPALLAHQLKDLLAEIEVLARSTSTTGVSDRLGRIAEAASRGTGIAHKLFDAQTATGEHETVRDELDDDTGEHPVLPASAAT
jgi:hypothetical protein